MVYEQCLIAYYSERRRPLFMDEKVTSAQYLGWIDPAFKGVRNRKICVHEIPGMPNPVFRRGFL